MMGLFIIVKHSPLPPLNFSLQTKTSAPNTHTSSTRYPFEDSLNSFRLMYLSKPHSFFIPRNRLGFHLPSSCYRCYYSYYIQPYKQHLLSLKGKRRYTFNCEVVVVVLVEQKKSVNDVYFPIWLEGVGPCNCQIERDVVIPILAFVTKRMEYQFPASTFLDYDNALWLKAQSYEEAEETSFTICSHRPRTPPIQICPHISWPTMKMIRSSLRNELAGHRKYILRPLHIISYS